MSFLTFFRLTPRRVQTQQAKTLAINPATTTHSQLTEEQQRAGGITPGLVRLSVGIETCDDIIADLEQAMG